MLISLSPKNCICQRIIFSKLTFRKACEVVPTSVGSHMNFSVGLLCLYSEQAISNHKHVVNNILKLDILGLEGSSYLRLFVSFEKTVSSLIPHGGPSCFRSSVECRTRFCSSCCQALPYISISVWS